MIQPASIILYNPDDQLQSFFVSLGISFFCHVLLFALVVFVRFPEFHFPMIETPTAITVDLVSFNPEIPIPETTTDAPNKNSVNLSEQKKMPLVDPPLESIIPIKQAFQKKSKSLYSVEKPDKIKVKKSLKRKTFNTAKIIEDAVKRIEDESMHSRPKSVMDRIDQLKHEVDDQSAAVGIKTKTKMSGRRFHRDFSQIEIYQAEVSVRLKNNWVFSEELAGNTRGLESRLVIKILRDGSITDVWFDQRSGNTYLDNSAYKTVMKSNPLPPLPEGYAYYVLQLRFTPLGLN